MIIAKKAAPWLFAAALALFASVAPGQADVTTPPSENPFAATDQNDDGAINSEEYRYRMLETFVLLDEDGNGVLTISETLAHQAQRISLSTNQTLSSTIRATMGGSCFLSLSSRSLADIFSGSRARSRSPWRRQTQRRVRSGRLAAACGGAW